MEIVRGPWSAFEVGQKVPVESQEHILMMWARLRTISRILQPESHRHRFEDFLHARGHGNVPQTTRFHFRAKVSPKMLRVHQALVDVTKDLCNPQGNTTRALLQSDMSACSGKGLPSRENGAWASDIAVRAKVRNPERRAHNPPWG